MLPREQFEEFTDKDLTKRKMIRVNPFVHYKLNQIRSYGETYSEIIEKLIHAADSYKIADRKRAQLAENEYLYLIHPIRPGYPVITIEDHTGDLIYQLDYKAAKGYAKDGLFAMSKPQDFFEQMQQRNFMPSDIKPIFLDLRIPKDDGLSAEP